MDDDGNGTRSLSWQTVKTYWIPFHWHQGQTVYEQPLQTGTGGLLLLSTTCPNWYQVLSDCFQILYDLSANGNDSASSYAFLN